MSSQKSLFLNKVAVAQHLRSFSVGDCSNVVDLSETVFSKEGEFGFLIYGKTKFHLNDWSVRQLCRMLQIPYSLFKKASQGLTDRIVGEFMPLTSDPTVMVQSKAIPGKADFIARGIVPVDYANLKNADVFDQIISIPNIEIISAPFYSAGQECPVNNVRIVLKDGIIEAGICTYEGVKQMDTLYIGADIFFSEIGGCALSINLLLWRLVCDNGALGRVGRGPFFFYDYTGSVPKVLYPAFSGSLDLAKTQLTSLKDKIIDKQQTQMTKEGMKTFVAFMRADQRVSKGVLQKTLGYFADHPLESEWDFINGFTFAAKSFRPELRSKYERVAGELLGFTVAREKSDELAMLSKSFKDVPTITEIIPQ